MNVTLQVDPDAKSDNYPVDSIVYLVMPDSLYTLLSTSAVIKAGETVAEFRVVFYPSRIDISKNFILPVTATNDADVSRSSNYGHVYFHTIGNPIAGAYSWNFIRYSNPAGTGSPDGTSFSGHQTLFSPVNPTFIKVPMGYYNHANYFITFKNTAGVLSNFKVEIDPAEVSGAWAAAGISIGQAPTILVENNNTKFTIHFTTATRNCTDIYYK
jgi:hypothetical protein